MPDDDFRDNEAVEFDMYCCFGVGIVHHAMTDNPGKGECDIEVLDFHWKAGFGRADGIDGFWCHDVPFSNLTRIREQDYPLSVKEYYVTATGLEPELVSTYTEQTRRRLKGYIEDLVQAGRFAGYYAKGFLCLSGSVFRKDVQEAQRCLEKCFEMEFNTNVIQTLGDIARDNGDYDRALKYYSIATFEGDSRALCCVADLFSEGLGVPRNRSLAMDLYYRAFSHTMEDMRIGLELTCFPEAALGLAQLYEDMGMGESAIFGKYLEAEYGLARRSGFGGDNGLAGIIDGGLSKYRNSVHTGRIENLDFLKAFDAVTLVSVGIKRRGRRLHFTFAAADGNPVLITIPEISACTLASSYSFTCPVDTFCPYREREGEDFICTGIEVEGEKILFLLPGERERSFVATGFSAGRPQEVPHLE